MYLFAIISIFFFFFQKKKLLKVIGKYLRVKNEYAPDGKWGTILNK